MNKLFSDLLTKIASVNGKRIICLTLLLLLGLLALLDYNRLGLARRTFVFYSEMEGNTVVENRMLRRSGDKGDRETDIRRYVDEALLGPVTPGSALLFPRETRLNAFMYRDEVVYSDLTEQAALPLEGGDVWRSLLTLNEGIRRNFPYIKNVKLFIGGNEAFFEEFRGRFANSADNYKTAP
jgi:hypothetical protein